MSRLVCYFNGDGCAVFCFVNTLIDCTMCTNKKLHDEFANKLDRIKYVEI